LGIIERRADIGDSAIGVTYVIENTDLKTPTGNASIVIDSRLLGFGEGGDGCDVARIVALIGVRADEDGNTVGWWRCLGFAGNLGLSARVRQPHQAK
jgi:hypothetical protein